MKETLLRLAKIQAELKSPKSQTNAFGNYKYRSCEDILEAVKPLLGDSVITISDDIWLVGDRYYIRATATLTDSSGTISNTAYAREVLEKKGMDPAQVTGATSSYARKYALNGLLLIDDTKDADIMDNTEKVVKVIKHDELVSSPCPKCGKPLTTRIIKGVEVIVCSTNGWDAVKKQAFGCPYIKWPEAADKLPEDEYFDKSEVEEPPF